MDTYTKFEELLRKKGITIYQFCKETGIPQSTIYTWRIRRGAVSVRTLRTIMEYFEIPIEYFL